MLTSDLSLCPQGMPLVSDPRRNINVDNSTLTLYDVSRNESGNYSCEAFNAEGTGTSLLVPLNVQCKYPGVAFLLKWEQDCYVRYHLEVYRVPLYSC